MLSIQAVNGKVNFRKFDIIASHLETFYNFITDEIAV